MCQGVVTQAALTWTGNSGMEWRTIRNGISGSLITSEAELGSFATCIAFCEMGRDGTERDGTGLDGMGWNDKYESPNNKTES